MTLNKSKTLAEIITRKTEIKYEDVFFKVKDFSEKQYKYAYALVFNNKIEELTNLIK